MRRTFLNHFKKVIITLFFYFSSLYGWDALAEFPGPERLNPSILNLEGKIYVIGGDDNIWPQYPMYDVWVYDTQSDNWEEKNTLPASLQHAWSDEQKAFFVIIDDIIYGMYRNKLHRYLPLDDNWDLFNTSFPGSIDKSPTGFSNGEKLYVGFGMWYSDGYYLGYYYLDKDIYEFDLSTSTWSWFDEWNDFNAGFKISTFDGSVYVLDTFGSDDVFSIYDYSLTEKTLDLITSIPLNYVDLIENDDGHVYYDSYVRNLGFIAMNETLHLLGGYDYNINAEVFHELHLYQNDHFQYSFDDSSWTFEGGTLPTNNPDFAGRGSPSLTSTGDNLYLGFGTGNYFEDLNPDGNYSHNDLWVLNTTGQILGDINGDGITNVLDVIILGNIILNGGDYNSIGDLNFDQTLNIFDILLIVDINFN